MTGRLQGKVVLIMGGGSPIGRAAALAFAQEEAKVVVADALVEDGEETARMIRELGHQAVFVKADLSRPGEVEALIEKAVATYGRLDCAFNSAGIERKRGLTAQEIIKIMMMCLLADHVSSPQEVDKPLLHETPDGGNKTEKPSDE